MSETGDVRSGPPPVGDVRTTLREMWETRPARRRDDRKVLGVAAAIARRYAIDPTLVRVVLVVAAFYGVGILLYLVGWLVLPTIGPDGRRQTSSGWAVVAAVVVGVVTVGSLAGGDAGTAVGVAVMAGLIYALHQSRGGAVEQAAATGAVAAGDTTVAGTSPGDTDDDGMPRPPAWDPLGVAPFAWDLPEPSTPLPPKEPRSWLTPATLGAALTAAGIALALGLLGVVGLGPVPVVATALLVVGLGLLVGAFLGGRHRGRGLIVAAVPLALVLVAAAPSNAAWRDGFDRVGDDGFGEQTWAPTSQVLPLYETGVGDATLDLRGLQAGPPFAPPVTTAVRSGVGEVTVLLPENADVRVDCSTGAGSVDCLDREERGEFTDLGPDGPGGPAIDLRATSGAGDVTVRRG